MDVLSDVLHVVRLTSAKFFRFDFRSPWSVSSLDRPDMARVLGVTEDRFMGFHVIVEGACWVVMDGLEPVRLEEGDVAVFPHGHAHGLYDDRSLPPRPVGSLLPPEPWEELPRIRCGGSGPTTRVLCGYLQCDQRFHPLAGSLPHLLRIQRREADGAGASGPLDRQGTVTVQAGDWLDMTLHHMSAEVERNQPGAMAMIARLGELLYVEVLRRYMCQAPPRPANWLSAVNDPDVGRVLRLIHAEPQRDWTVEGLAHAVGVSRSLLAQRFTAIVGQSPMKYLGEWRVQLAKQMLPQPGVSISQIADRVGYGSEASFNRAFKRSVGQPPAAWRRTAAGTVPLPVAREEPTRGPAPSEPLLPGAL